MQYYVGPTAPSTSPKRELSEATGALGGLSAELSGEAGVTVGLTLGGSWVTCVFLFEAFWVGAHGI